MVLVLVTIAVAAVLVAVVASRLLQKQFRPEDGHDRAARRERDWYTSGRR